MTSWHRDITPRRSVHSTEDMRKHTHRDESSRVFIERLERIMREKIEKWPPPLQDIYTKCREKYEMEEEAEEESALDIMLGSLLLMEDENLSPKQNILLKDCLDSYVPESGIIQSKIESNAIQSSNTSSSKIKNSVIFMVLISVIFAYFIVFPWNNPVEPNKIEEWTKNIRDLQKQFPSQNEDIWSDIVSGIKAIVTDNPTKPSVLLLLHNDERTSTCLARKIGNKAVGLLSDTLQDPIIIRGEELKLNESLTRDYGLFSETYKHDIEKKHVMIVLDLQEIPAVLAQTFHVLCDVENPLVRNAAILFTMQVDEYEKQRPTAIAEKKLKLLWKDTLDNDIIDPLITRITNAVVAVKLEAHIPC